MLHGDLSLDAGDVVAFAIQTGDPWGSRLPAHSAAEILEAPTTSLPEQIGGIRKWDYRYTWVRDASFTIGALAASGCGFEATRFFDFFTNATAGSLASGQGLQIMYGIRGERFIPEHELQIMEEHRGSRPVRIGNGAWDQAQLDVYGELLDAAWARCASRGASRSTTMTSASVGADDADRELPARGFVYRYLNEDGPPGGEGTFGICTFWLAECLARAGEQTRARALFDLMAGCANDVGLLAEEVDPATGELLGNFPQAFTYIGLIHAALAIDAASSGNGPNDR